MIENKIRYSDSDLQEFKDIILKKMARAEEDLALLESSYKNGANNDTDDTFQPLNRLKKVLIL